MSINKKIKDFLEVKKLTFTEVGKKYGTSQQNISKYLKDGGNIPLDFIVWLAVEFPEFDLNKLVRDSSNEIPIIEDRINPYGNKEAILREIGLILDKHL